MRLEKEKYSEWVNISGDEPSGGEHSGRWTIRGMNIPRAELSGGWNVRGWNVLGWNRGRGESSGRLIIHKGEKKNYKGVNRPGVNHKRGETSGIQIFCIFLFILQTCIGGFRVSTISTYFYFSQDFLSASYRFLPVDFLSYV